MPRRPPEQPTPACKIQILSVLRQRTPSAACEIEQQDLNTEKMQNSQTTADASCQVLTRENVCQNRGNVRPDCTSSMPSYAGGSGIVITGKMGGWRMIMSCRNAIRSSTQSNRACILLALQSSLRSQGAGPLRKRPALARVASNPRSWQLIQRHMSVVDTPHGGLALGPLSSQNGS